MTNTRGVIVRVNLIKPLTAEVRLLIQYADVRTGKVDELITTTRYRQTEEITYIDETVPFKQFTVAVALVSGSVIGPLNEFPLSYGK